ncbi:MAG: YebC/PmpR family DNA-binding transcriptional regulator [Candidatus Dojkabacteria bacterium]
MSGHSKWSTIKHKKGINDAKKGKIFSKLAQQIVIAAREGGADPDANASLRMVLQKAKAASMPSVNIERAIQKGAGTGEGGPALEKATYEGFGPGKLGIIVEVLTDNKNRSVSEVRIYFSEKGGALGEPGSVSWNFDKKGHIVVRAGKTVKATKFGAEDTVEAIDPEEVMLALMEVPNVLDIQISEDEDEGYMVLEVFTDPTHLGQVRDAIASLGFILLSAELAYFPKSPKSVSVDERSKLESFLEGLDDMDDVMNVWSELE